MAAFHYGLADVDNDMMPLVREYLERQTLAAVGVQTTTAQVPGFKCDCFVVIAGELAHLRARDAARKRTR